MIPQKTARGPIATDAKGRRALQARQAGDGFLLAALLALWWMRATLVPASAAGQGAESGDLAAVADAIERLPVVGSVLLTGAHPDDENNALLAYMARGMHLRTAYLSATRGDGGQNLLGNEQYEALGILRTEELLAARRIDGAQQFFGQEYDFGFSKSADETLQKWGHDNVLRDYVRVIREFRPDVLISRFTGTPSDGHGHHQASGIITKEAFTAAADASKFPELATEGIKPWQAKWLFINSGGGGGRGGPAPGTITMALGGFDPLYGEDLGDLGSQARSQHRSQGMGQSPRGPYSASFRFLNSAPGSGGAPTKSPFEGIDLTLDRFTKLAGGDKAAGSDVEKIKAAIDNARHALTVDAPAKTLPDLAQGLDWLHELQSHIKGLNIPDDSKDLALFWLQRKEEDFDNAIALAGGVKLDATAESSELVPGSKFTVIITGTVREQGDLDAVDVNLTGPAGWKIERTTPVPPPSRGQPSMQMKALQGRGGAGRPEAPRSANFVEARFAVAVPTDAPLSQPYWLAGKREGDYFNPAPGPWVGDAHQPALLHATFQMTAQVADGKYVTIAQTTDVVNRFTDRIYGEREAPLALIPQLGVWLQPGVTVFPKGGKTTRAFLARVRNNTNGEEKGTLHLTLPPGWQSTPPSAPFDLVKQADETAIRFEVSPPTTAGAGGEARQPVQAVAEASGSSFSTGYMEIDYPHIHKNYWFQPAAASLEQFDVKVAPGLKVGYIMGSGDEVPDGLKQLGVDVTQLTGDDLAFGDLKRFNVIVTGIRAYEVRKDISANNGRLMDYVKDGGVMIVQYSRPGGFSDVLSPYPMKMDVNARVSVEEAPVEILDPANALFHYPNEITAKDFDGWVQERGTYFMVSWGPEFKPLLESHDPGEQPQKGGMLLAQYGKGYYLYSGYVWFRQLPAGVPGAYRLFANMISLGKNQSRGAAPKAAKSATQSPSQDRKSVAASK